MAELKKWQVVVKPNELIGKLKETYERKNKSGESRTVNRYRQSYTDVEAGSIILNDVSREDYQKFARERSKEKNKEKREEFATKVQKKADRVKKVYETKIAREETKRAKKRDRLLNAIKEANKGIAQKEAELKRI